mgnify:CR=1 FL=1
MRNVTCIALALVGFLLLGGSLATAEEIQNFEDPAAVLASLTATANGSPVAPGFLVGGPAGTGNFFLRLTHDISDQNNELAFHQNSVSGPQPDGISLAFDFRMSGEEGYPGSERGNGFGVALLPFALLIGGAWLAFRLLRPRSTAAVA